MTFVVREILAAMRGTQRRWAKTYRQTLLRLRCYPFWLFFFQAWAYMTAASVTCAICAVASLICFFGTRETGSNLTSGAVGEGDRDGVNETKMLGFFTAVQKVLTFPPYLYLMGAFLFMSLGIQVSWLLFNFYLPSQALMAPCFVFFTRLLWFVRFVWGKNEFFLPGSMSSLLRFLWLIALTLIHAWSPSHLHPTPIECNWKGIDGLPSEKVKGLLLLMKSLHDFICFSKVDSW